MVKPHHTRIFLVLGHTDMRKSINGLSISVKNRFEMDPFSGYLFVFCNRRKNIIKVLYWDRNGFCLWQKRLEKDRFKWPTRIEELKEIDRRQLDWLLEGLDIEKIRGHGRLFFREIY